MTTTTSAMEHTLDDLEAERQQLRLDRQALTERIGLIEMEYARRRDRDHPGYSPETGGSVQLVQGNTILVCTFSLDYAYDERAIMELARSEALTAEEYNRLVEFIPKVDGRVYNDFIKRGGGLAEELRRLRSVKSARPEFRPKQRAG